MRHKIDEGLVGGLIATFIYGLLAVVVFLGFVTTGHCDDHISQATKKPKVELTVSPRMCLSPCNLTLSLRIKDADDSTWCPRVTWAWPDNTRSVTESDCDPNPAEKDMAYQSWSKRVTVGPGEHVFVVIIEKGKMRKTLQVKVEVK